MKWKRQVRSSTSFSGHKGAVFRNRHHGMKKKKRQKNLFDLLQLTNGVFAVRLREEMIKYGEKSTLSNILWPIPILFV